MLIRPFLHSPGGVYDENVFFASLIHIITKLGGLSPLSFLCKNWSWYAWKECFGESFLAGLSGALAFFVRGGTGVFLLLFLYMWESGYIYSQAAIFNEPFGAIFSFFGRVEMGGIAGVCSAGNFLIRDPPIAISNFGLL